MSSTESTTPSSTSSSGIRESVRALKARLTEGRRKIRDQVELRAHGTQVCNRLADLIDGIVLDLYEERLAEFKSRGAGALDAKVALVPCGGYGRRDVVPYSDVDLILLYDPTASAARDFSRRLMRDLSDLGIALGFNSRTIADAVQDARKDATIFTAQAESRYLAGSVRLYTKYASKLRADAKRRSRTYIQRIERAREQEHKRYGETVYLLEPDVKRSLGALRDIHLLRWIGFARYRETQPSALCLMGALRPEDERALRHALDFLLRVRVELHFRAGRSNDVLGRFEQLRIAEAWRYTESSGLLPVQKFMRDYFFHTGQVRDVVYNFIASARHRPLASSVLAPLVTHRMENHYLVGPIHISTTATGKERLKGSLAEVLKMMSLANQADKQISHDTWTAIRQDMAGKRAPEFTDGAGRRFLSLLAYSARLGHMLRLLHELRVLEKILIGFGHARHLLQFNHYHKYTVDEHCIRSVEKATELFSKPGPLGRAYRSLKKRTLLHLALLIHDLGKGYDEDHSEVGRRVALENAKRLKLTAVQTKMLEFLVHKHLMMAHLAFRRDTSDQQLILQFAHEVGSPEALQMLYLLTAADVAAVGPQVLNPWKVEVLTDLYQRTMYHLVGRGTTAIPHRKAEESRIAVRSLLPDDDDDSYLKQLRALPASYIADHEPAEMASDLIRLHARAAGESIAWGRHLQRAGVTEYLIATPTSNQREGFHKIVGALTSHGLKILAGLTHGLPDECTLLRFQVEDLHSVGTPTDERMDEVAKYVVAALHDTTDACPVFARTWGSVEAPPPAEELPARVEFDNATLSEFTIVDIFTTDHVSLNYKAARTVFDAGLVAWYTKTGSSRDQVVLVIYITQQDGRKVENRGILSELRALLLAATENSSATR